MKTCADCEHFTEDVDRSKRLGEPIGLCEIDHCWKIGCFDAEEDCDGFEGKMQL